MAYQKIYSREHWENFPSEKTAINRDRLNNIEGGIDAIDDRVCALDTTKVDLTKANELVKEILWDESNGTLTVVKMNGSKAVIDTKLEKLAVNFKYNPQTQQLVITLDDGTVQNVDLSSLITEYEFLDSDTIAFEIVDGKVKANVKNGSITEDHLSPDYLGEIRTQVGKAEMSAKSADASEKNAVSSSTLAKSYAVGGTGTREGEDTDNARYYMEQAKAVSAVDIATTEKAGIVKPDGTTITADEDGTLHGVAKITVDTALSSTSTNPVQNKVVTSNLTNLKYGEVAGGKNLFKNYDHYGVYEVATETYNGNSVIYSSRDWSGAYQSDLILKKGKTYAISAYVKGSGRYFIYCDQINSGQSVGIEVEKDLNSEWTKITKVYTPNFDVHKVRLEVRGGSLYISCFQIEEGTQATDYEPYIPSVKMLEEKADKSETTVNLLKSTLQTTTQNGVTCTNNGDGTYTLNGTATSNVRFQFGIDDNLIVGKTYKALGIPISGSFSTVLMGWDYHGYFNKDGLIDKKTSEPRPISMQVLSGYTCDNLVFKPMLTTNLSATYDDFVPYTGDTGRLNGDVAELRAQSVKKADTISYDKSASTLYLKSGSTVLSSTEIKSGGGATITPKPTVNPQIKNDDKKVVITWEDPTDTVIEDSTFSKWAGTKLVMKESGYPTSPDDGTVLVDNTTRNKYKTSGFTKTGLTNDKKYYFALFPYSTDGVYNYDSGNRLLGEPTELKIVTFAGGTDAEIAKMIQAHYNNKINVSDYWAVGDTRTVSLSAMSATGVGESHRAQTVQLVILDFEHDDLATAINGHSKAAVSIGLKYCLMDASNALNPVNGGGNTENGYMNSSATNAGGWKNCARRAWCNNVFFAALPSTWQSMVKIVNKKSGTGGGSSSGTEITADKIFLAAEIEIFGSRTYSVDGEGTQYQYYKNATANRYKMPKWGSSYVSNIYWERSPFSGGTNGFCAVSSDGNASYGYANGDIGVAPCLCI